MFSLSDLAALAMMRGGRRRRLDQSRRETDQWQSFPYFWQCSSNFYLTVINGTDTPFTFR